MTTDVAEKLLYDHNHPLTKVQLNRTKLFLSPSNNDDNEKCLATVENSLMHQRVERRQARAKALWLPSQNLVRITKSSGPNFSHFGYQDKTGKFLYPEEALFLLETNKLEILHKDGIPISIQEGYEILLNKSCNFHKYSVYKKLALQGYKLLRKLKSVKRKFEGSLDEPAKKISRTEGHSKIDEIFAKLRETAPKDLEMSSSEQQPDYFVFLPKNSSRTDPDFRLFIRYDENLTDVEFTGEHSSVYAFPLRNMAFYEGNQVNLPIL